MKKQLGFYVDAKRCIGCFACAMACKNQYHQASGVVWRQVYPLKEEVYPHHERAFYSLSCNHCEHPACMEVCPAAAYTKREQDGVVVHHQEKCIGCANCVRSCPYGAPRFNPGTERAEKCNLGSHRARLSRPYGSSCGLATYSLLATDPVARRCFVRACRLLLGHHTYRCQYRRTAVAEDISLCKGE